MVQEMFGVSHLRFVCIKRDVTLVREELKEIVFNTFTKKWKQSLYRLNSRQQVSSFVSESDIDFIKCLLWQPRAVASDLTVFVSNVSDGWQSIIDIYSTRKKLFFFRVEVSDKSDMFPAYTFEVNSCGNRRIIKSSKDYSKWEFYQNGKLLPFENEKYYTKKKIADRMNNDIIIEYLSKNQIDIINPDFWTSKGDAVEFSNNLKL
jgi:hypothetical protein